MGRARTRSAGDVITDALADNLWWERLCYGIVLVCVLTGVAGVVAGIVRGDGLISLSGTGFAALFWPAMRYARAMRQDNMRIRLYEIALQNTTDPKEAVAILREAIGRAPDAKDRAP